METQNITPGSFITISGAKPGDPGGWRTTVPPPTVLGGSCVTFGDVAVPLLAASNGEIQALVARGSLARKACRGSPLASRNSPRLSDPVILTVRDNL